jgi:hypothetical protein
MLIFPVVVIAHGGKIGPRTMRTKLNNNNTHNADIKEKVEENYITLPLKASGMKQKRPGKRIEGFEKRPRQKNV